MVNDYLSVPVGSALSSKRKVTIIHKDTLVLAEVAHTRSYHSGILKYNPEKPNEFDLRNPVTGRVATYDIKDLSRLLVAVP